MKNLKIQVNSDLTSEGINKIRDQSISALNNETGVIFDLSDIPILSDNVVLLLFQIRDFLKEKQITCSIVGLTGELKSFLSILGLHDTFALRGVQ